MYNLNDRGGQIAGRVRENNATSGPDSSAEAKMDWVELVIWGRVMRYAFENVFQIGNNLRMNPKLHFSSY